MCWGSPYTLFWTSSVKVQHLVELNCVFPSKASPELRERTLSHVHKLLLQQLFEADDVVTETHCVSCCRARHRGS